MSAKSSSLTLKDAGTDLHGHIGADGKTAKVCTVLVSGVQLDGRPFDSYAPVASLEDLLITCSLIQSTVYGDPESNKQ